jgi:hypothetical protein
MAAREAAERAFMLDSPLPLERSETQSLQEFSPLLTGCCGALLSQFRRDILRLNSRERDGCEEQALQAHFAAGGVVPLGGGVRAPAFSAAAE